MQTDLKLWNSIAASAKILLDKAREQLDNLPSTFRIQNDIAVSVKANPEVFPDSFYFTITLEGLYEIDGSDRAMMKSAVVDSAVGYKASLVLKVGFVAELRQFAYSDAAWQELTQDLYNSYFTLTEDDVIYR